MAGTPPSSPSAAAAAAAKATQDGEIDQCTAQEVANAATLEAQRLAKELRDAYDAAMARALQAEEEAVAAAIALNAALARASLERADAEAAIAPPKPPPRDGDDDPTNLHTAMLLHEAAALLNLHAQAIAVTNIRSLVSIMLDVDSGNLNLWRDQFLVTLGKFSLQDHVNCDAPAAVSPD